MMQITAPERLGRLASLRKAMLSGVRQYDFRIGWLNSRKMEAVPVESAARIPLHDIPRLSRVLVASGVLRAVAINTDMPADQADAFDLAISPEEFFELNRTLGMFRFLLASESEEWAISCNEWYNLFAAPPELLEKLLGKPIGQARVEFDAYARMLGGSLPAISDLYSHPRRSI